jgi:membrane fusion protein (multidrug efflux system)
MNIARHAIAVAALALVAAGCGKKQQQGGPGGWGVPVKTAVAVVQPVEEKISLVATLSANEAVDIQSEMDGAVKSINFEEGQSVTNSQLLFELDTGKLDASVAEAEARFRLAEANMKRSESMVANKTISMQEHDQAVASFESARATLDLMKQQLRDSRIFAGFDGVMGARLVSPGQVIAKNTKLSTLVDTDPIKVDFHVPERFIGELRAGQAIQFTAPAYRDEPFRGEVYFIAPQVDPQNRTVWVKATAANADGRLRPGMFGNLDLILRVKDQAVIVPESAIVYQADIMFVYRVKEDQSVERIDVKTGARLPGLAEITEGVAAGDRVVVEGVQKLMPGAKISEAPPAPEGGQPADVEKSP